MRTARILAWLMALALAGFGSGCRTPAPVSGETEGVLSAPNAALAQALASFSMGVLLEGQRDPAVLTNYRRAIELQPNCQLLYVRLASQYMLRGEAAKAVSVLEEACRHNPRSLDAWLYLAQLYQMLRQLDAAEKAGQQAIRAAPANSKGYIQLASICLDRKDDARALEILEQALTRVDDRLPILRLLGDLHSLKIGARAQAVASPHLKQAIQYYQQAAAMPPDDLSPAYLQRLGDLYILSRQINEAIPCFTNVIVRQPDDVALQKKLALCYMAVGNRNKALEYLRAIAGREPENVEIQYYLGELYEGLDDWNDAAASYKAACAVTPQEAQPYLKLALLYLKSDPDQAFATLQAGLQQMPDDKRILELLAHAYLQADRPEQALTAFERLRIVGSRESEAVLTPRFYFSYGVTALRCKRFDLAAILFQEALERDPAFLEASLRLAFLELNRKQPQAALDLMREAVWLRPDDPNAYYYFGIIASRSEDYRAAIEAFEKVAALAEHDPQGALLLDSGYYFNLGTACDRDGQWERAEALIERALEMDSENAEAFNYLAYTWAEKGIKLDRARAYVGHALDLDPDNAAFVDTLGWIDFKKGCLEAALEQIQNALALMPDDPTIAEHLGDVLAALHRMDEARQWWRYCLQLSPGNPAVEKKLNAP